MNTETIPDPVQAIRAALMLGPTPGPWTTISRATYHWEEEADVLDAHGNDIESAEFVKPIGDVPTTRGQMYMRDAQFIAAANPQALGVLLDRLEAAERRNAQQLDLAANLRKLATGRVEWRVQHPVERCYCISFDRNDSTDPKGEAEAWLIDHQRHFPNSPHAKYEVAEVRVFSQLEQAALDAAQALDPQP